MDRVRIGRRRRSRANRAGRAGAGPAAARTDYDAFVSYSHAADEPIAAAIQSGLYRLARPFYRLRALSVFRDKTGLGANSGLWPAIEDALSRSRRFILLASPQSAASEWVDKEVAWWLEHRAPETMMIVLTAGELSWDDARRDFDWQRPSAVSDTLRGRFHDEPLYADLRWAREASDLKLRNPRFRDAILDLASPLRGKAKNDLASAEVRQARI